MNIFATDPCPIKCAQFLDDKRVIKMCLETAQILATNIRIHGGTATYKMTHENHPATVWARETRSNYMWLYEHFKALCNEFEARRDKVHACVRFLNEFEKGAQYIPEGPLTPFVNCAARKDLGISYKYIKDTTLAYQLYLNDRWDTDKLTPKWYGQEK